MEKTKSKKNASKKHLKKKMNLTKTMLEKIDLLSWEMGKKKYSSREELYGR